jgi:Arylsulfotransferase (ASST)
VLRMAFRTRDLPGGFATAITLTVLVSATTLALGGRRILTEPAANAVPSTPSVGRCTPTVLNRSAVLPGTSLAVSPLPDSYDASPQTQISLLGAPASAIASVSVQGSVTGPHEGRLLAYSQGDGASFVPSRGFVPGETVMVRGRLRAGATEQAFAFHFVIAHREPVDYQASGSVHHPSVSVHHDYNEVQHFHSRPGLEAPVLVLSTRTGERAPGGLFAAPYSGPGPSGPMIFEEDGNLVWFDPLAPGIEATDLQVQSYEGQQVLTWWQGRIPPQGFGQGEDLIANNAYQVIAHVHAGNGEAADLHEFRITPQDTALVTVFQPIACDLSALGGPADGAVTASIFQEIDLRTGLVRREWDSLDHVALSESYSSAQGSSTIWPFDYFHLNSVDPLAGGATLISARNTSALYELNTTTGQVVARIGGRRSTVKLAPGAATAYQHDALGLPNGTIIVFDNGGVPKVHSQSRGLVVALDAQTHSVSVVAEYDHATPPLLSDSQGNAQALEDGNVFIGWGAEPYFSEYSSSGELLYDAHWHGSYESYRAFRFQWTGAPNGPPAIAASAAGGRTIVYASWNGDTRTASWRVLEGPTPQQLTPVASAAKDGFETAISAPIGEGYVAAQALSATGEVLGTSPTIQG